MLMSRRVKCDRNHPCQNCTKRGQAGTCTYLNASTYKRAGQPSTSSEAASMRQRVIQLERLLRSFIAPSDAGVSTTMDSQASASQGVNTSVNLFGVLDGSEESTSDGDMSGTNIVLDRSCPPLGRISLENAETNYVGSAHWAAVLDEVGNNHILLLKTCQSLFQRSQLIAYDNHRLWSSKISWILTIR